MSVSTLALVKTQKFKTYFRGMSGKYWSLRNRQNTRQSVRILQKRNRSYIKPKDYNFHSAMQIQACLVSGRIL